MGFSEADIISLLQKCFASSDSRILVGIGDDAAVVSTSKPLVITTDMAVEGSHFRTDWSSAFDIGRKITAANIADVLSMGAQCTHLVAAVSLTGDEEMAWIEGLALGMKHEADLIGASIVGGDLTRGPQIVIAMTAIGEVENAITRSGAHVGDDIFISSLPGWSAAGLHLLTQEISINSELADKALSEFSAPTLDYSMDYTKAHALADVSDSLMVQGAQMATASSAAFSLEPSLIEAAPEFAELKTLAEEVNVDVWDWILAGGEDHIFLATGDNLPGIKIGTVIAGSGLLGLEMKKAPVSWSHFQ